MSEEDFDPSPFEDVDGARDFILDLAKLASNLQSLDAVIAELSQSKTLVTPSRLARCLSKAGWAEEHIETFSKMANSLDADKQDEFLDFLKRATEYFELGSKTHGILVKITESFLRLGDKLKQLQKAEGLTRAVGNELVAVGLICDNRPVYNETKEAILGFVPMLQTSLIYQEQNGQSKSLFLALTEQDVDFLIASLVRAQKKLDVLRKHNERTSN